MTTYIKCVCSQCSITFERHRKQFYKLKRTSNVFCNKKCSSLFRANSKIYQCSQCGQNTKPIVPSQISETGNVFCNHSCSATYHNTHKTKGYRRSKLEIWLEEELRQKYTVLDLYCNKIDSINAELDIHFPKLRIAFELNGIFHYKPIYGHKKLLQTQTTDNKKLQLCLNNNIELHILDVSKIKHLTQQIKNNYLNLISTMVDNKITTYTDLGFDIKSLDPMRGRTNPPPPKKEKQITYQTSKHLETAMLWQSQIDNENITQADIARREGFSRVYVMRILRLQYLPEDIKDTLLKRTCGQVNLGRMLDLAYEYKQKATPSDSNDLSLTQVNSLPRSP